MVDVSQFTNVAGLAVLVGSLVQLTKGFIKPEKVPFYAIAMGIVLALSFGYVVGNLKTLADVASYGMGGLLAALITIGGYETTIDKIRLK